MATTVDSEILKNAPATKAPAKKTTKAKAPAAKKPAAKKAAAAKPAAEGVVTRNKLGPNAWLQDAILKVCEDFAAGKLDLEGKTLTPHRIASLIETPNEPGKHPSSGAVSAALDRWVGYKFITVHEKPKAFKAFTAAGKKEGLEAMVKKHTAALSKARKAAKA